ncbi:MAG: sulfotransferase [bacterium]
MQSLNLASRRPVRRLRDKVVKRRFILPDELKNGRRLSEAIQCLREKWPTPVQDTQQEESPVFIFSAGWRSGSTLLQRLIISSGEVAVWGEPLGEAGIIPRLAMAISAIDRRWPPDQYFLRSVDISGLSNQWIANLTPDMAFLWRSQRAMLREWMGAPVKEKLGMERWGFKEVRLTIHHARYLKWLFPNARFLFIYRNLYDSYRSWKGNQWRNLWPGYYSRSPAIYALHWKHLLGGFLDGYKDVDGMMIRFEDLIAGKLDLACIASHIGVRNLDPGVLSQKIGSPKRDEKKKREKLSSYERLVLSAVAAPMLKRAGYPHAIGGASQGG